MVITEELRQLLYPLGIVSTLAFTLRFLIQWIQSEAAHHSIVTKPFWIFSIIGNISLGVHSIIQGQFAICLVQALNGVIAIRNLNLMQPLIDQWSLKTVLYLFISSIALSIGAFITFSNEDWFRVPTHFFQSTTLNIPFGWHLIGSLGVVLFASRFWIQWLQSERAHKSLLDRPFWWISLAGAILSIIYFALIRDYINLVGPLFGLIPYCRNLILLHREDP